MVSPPPSPLLPLSSQVGGHTGMLTTEDGSLIIKPALPLELEFYEKYSSHPSFEPLRPFLPKFFGTLKLEGTLDETKPESLTVKPLMGAEAVQKDEFDFPICFCSYLACCLYRTSCSKISHIRSPSRIFWTSNWGLCSTMNQHLLTSEHEWKRQHAKPPRERLAFA